MPGSIRSGEKARLKSTPALSPDAFSRIGRTSSSVVPGYVVDSSTTSVPRRSSRPAVSEAARTAVRSGPSASDSGVGTQMTMVSGSPAPGSLVVARKPAASIWATSSSEMSSTWECPPLRPFTTPWPTSYPTALRPAFVASRTRGRPT